MCLANVSGGSYSECRLNVDSSSEKPMNQQLCIIFTAQTPRLRLSQEAGDDRRGRESKKVDNSQYCNVDVRSTMSFGKLLATSCPSG